MEPQIFITLDQHASYFKSFIGLLADKFKPLQIFCFSKRLISEEIAGNFRDHSATYKAHYCLLMVTETNTRIDYEVQDYCNGKYEDGTITILCHGQEAISEAIQKNNRFFITVYSSGELIYSHNGIVLSNLTKRFDLSYSSLKAKKHLEHHSYLAKGFLTGANECLNNEQYNVCTFIGKSCIAAKEKNIPYLV